MTYLESRCLLTCGSRCGACRIPSFAAAVPGVQRSKGGRAWPDPQQHQALLAIRATAESAATIGYVAERLILKPHSASGLIDRLEKLGLVMRRPSPEDRRQALLTLTSEAHLLLGQLSITHRHEIRRLHPMLSGLLASLDHRQS